MEFKYSVEIPSSISKDVKLFKNFIALERGLSKNTTESYLSDLKQFIEYMFNIKKN